MPTIVLVTGCSAGGIGHSLCEEFAERGCKVYASARNLDKMGDFGQLSVEKLRLDVTSDEDVKNAIEHILEAEGKIDILVNNAGVMCPGPVIDQSLEYVKQVFDTNTFSALRVAKAVIPAMAKRRRGLVVNIGSIVGEIPTPWNGVYCASKAALHALTEVLSMECKPFDISVLLVSPGAVKSQIAANAAARFQLADGSLYKAFIPNIMQRINASQQEGQGPMATKEFAERVVGQALKEKPGTYMTLGGSSVLFSILKWLPRRWPLWLLWREYSKGVR